MQPVVKPVVQPVWQPAASCKQTSNGLSNRVWQPVERTATVRSTGCETRFGNRLNEQWLFVQPVVKPGCRTVWQPVWQPAIYTIQLVVKSVVKQVWQPVECVCGLCLCGLTTVCLTTRLTTGCIVYTNIQPVDNRFDNRLYRVNGASVNGSTVLCCAVAYRWCLLNWRSRWLRRRRHGRNRYR